MRAPPTAANLSFCVSGDSHPVPMLPTHDLWPVSSPGRGPVRPRLPVNRSLAGRPRRSERNRRFKISEIPVSEGDSDGRDLRAVGNLHHNPVVPSPALPNVRLSAPATDAASLRTDGSRDLIADQPREIRRKSVCHLAGGNDPVSRRLQPIRGRRTHLEFATERLTATVTAMREPAPGTLSTRKLPPSASTRSRMPVMP